MNSCTSHRSDHSFVPLQSDDGGSTVQPSAGTSPPGWLCWHGRTLKAPAESSLAFDGRAWPPLSLAPLIPFGGGPCGHPSTDSLPERWAASGSRGCILGDSTSVSPASSPAASCRWLLVQVCRAGEPGMAGQQHGPWLPVCGLLTHDLQQARVRACHLGVPSARQSPAPTRC